MEFVLQHLETILMAIFGSGSLIAYLKERKKNSAQVNTVEIENSQKIIHTYQETLDDLKRRYEERYQEFAQTMEQNKKLLEEEIRLHKRRCNALKQENNELRKRLKEYEGAS